MPISPKVSRWIRSAARKRRASLQYRRRSGAPTTSSSSTLARARATFRYANPPSITLSNQRTCSFTRTVAYSIALNESTGWGGSSSYSLAFGFQLAQIVGTLSGVYSIFLPVPNYTEFQALFDYYKIGNVRMKMFFSNNTSSLSSPATALPIIHISNDYDDINAAETVNSILERAGTRSFQFTADHQYGISHYLKPQASQYVMNVDGTGFVASTNGGVAPTGQWLNTAATQILHNGVKLVWNPQGRTSNTDIGTVTFLFEVEYMFKGFR